MRKIALLLATITTLSWGFQDREAKPTISTEPLTSEQVEIYRTFLQTYIRGSKRTLNLANVTDPIDYSPAEIKQGQGCLHGIDFENLQEANSVVHHMDPAVAGGLKITLVNPLQQIAVVKENDPQKAVGRDDKQVDRAVDTAFATGLFTFSEIAFNKKHTLAVLTFSFYCGRLCGHGGVLLFHRRKKGWKLTKRDCGFWMS